MALYAQIPKDPEKIRQGIFALEWRLTQEVPENDRKIYMRTLEAYRRALNGSASAQEKIIV